MIMILPDQRITPGATPLKKIVRDAMENIRTALLGIGATGSVLAAALLKNDPEIILVDPKPGLAEEILDYGIKISGPFESHIRPLHFLDRIEKMKDFDPRVIFISSKTFHLSQILDELKRVVSGEAKIICTQNGLGPEDLVADMFGKASAFRMSLNFGVSLKGPGEVEMAFFNRPNHLGSLTPDNREMGQAIAKRFTESGLDTEYVEDIRINVWKKMIVKCTMASLCAVTDTTIKEALDFPPTREIVDASFGEILAVAKAKGYDLGENYIKQALEYLQKVGAHKDSMCVDIANRTPTEIDFLGGKVVEYGRETGVPTPVYMTMTNLVKAMEHRYLSPKSQDS